MPRPKTFWGYIYNQRKEMLCRNHLIDYSQHLPDMSDLFYSLWWPGMAMRWPANTLGISRVIRSLHGEAYKLHQHVWFPVSSQLLICFLLVCTLIVHRKWINYTGSSWQCGIPNRVPYPGFGLAYPSLLYECGESTSIWKNTPCILNIFKTPTLQICYKYTAFRYIEICYTKRQIWTN